MIDKKIKLEILDRLREDNFIHEENYEEKFSEIIEDLTEEERDYINTKYTMAKESNNRKTIQIDFFDMLIYEKKEYFTLELLRLDI